MSQADQSTDQLKTVQHNRSFTCTIMTSDLEHVPPPPDGEPAAQRQRMNNNVNIAMGNNQNDVGIFTVCRPIDPQLNKMLTHLTFTSLQELLDRDFNGQ